MMANRPLLRLTLLLLTTFGFAAVTSCEAQAVFVLASTNSDPIQGIYTLDEDLSWREVITFSFDQSFGDLAIDDQGAFYGITSSGRVCAIDTLTAEVSVLVDLPSIAYTSLVFNADGLLYTLALNGDLISIDPVSGETSVLLSLGSTSPGDLTYIQGWLVYQGTNGPSIDAYNMVTGEQGAVFCDLPTNTALWGLSNQLSNCNSNRIFAFDFLNRVFLYDFEEDTVLEVETDLTALQGRTFRGAATDTEYLASVCPMDMEIKDCDALGLDDFYFSPARLAPNPCSDEFQLQPWPEGVSQIDIRLIDAKGQVVAAQSVTEGQTVQVDLPVAIYTVVGVSAHGLSFSARLVVAH